MQKYLRHNGILLNRGTNKYLYREYIPLISRVSFQQNTCELGNYTVQNGSRTHFLVLPNGADNSQFGDISNGLHTSVGSHVFWVTYYNISPIDGSLYVEGFKASNNSNSCQWNSNNWPSLNSNYLYYYTSYRLGNNTYEINKRGVETPTNAIAALVTYTYPNTEYLVYCSVETDKVYKDLSDCTCGFIMDTSIISTITNLQANTTYEFNISGSDMVYPLQTNRTIVCGSMNYLENFK